MYGLESSTDLTFLIGKELTQISYGLYQLILRLDPDVTISIESGVRLQAARVDGAPKQAAALSAMLGACIVHIENLGQGQLLLRFSNNQEIVLLDGNDDAESYTVSYGASAFVV